MKTLKLALLFSVLIVPLTGRAATGDIHVVVEASNGTYNELRVTPSGAGALYQDGNGNWSFVAIPASVPVLSSGDISVTTSSLTAGTGVLLGKFTQTVTYTTAFATGVVPTVSVVVNGLVTSGYATSITNTGFTLVLPANVSASGTMQYVAIKKQ